RFTEIHCPTPILIILKNTAGSHEAILSEEQDAEYPPPPNQNPFSLFLFAVQACRQWQFATVCRRLRGE
ncbi:MAG TPA: hypothetical protein PK198_07740, partial [Saprospiraceae bacterium]|nr:hypothetical protein [Saprospiraceae bacterium]